MNKSRAWPQVLLAGCDFPVICLIMGNRGVPVNSSYVLHWAIVGNGSQVTILAASLVLVIGSPSDASHLRISFKISQ